MVNRSNNMALSVVAILALCTTAAYAQIHTGHGGHSTPALQSKAKASGITPTTANQPETDTLFRAALAAGNAELAASYLSDDVLIFEGGGVERSKAEYAGHHLGGDIAFSQATQFTLTKRSVQLVGDIAITTSESRTTGNYRGRALNLLGTETMVLRREAGQWRITHIHWSSKSAPAASQ